MKTTSMLLALSVITVPAYAAGNPQEATLEPVRAVQPKPIVGYPALQLLGLETGLTAPQVRMVLTTEARHAYYRFRKDRDSKRQFERELGSQRYADLIDGQPIALHSPAVLEAAQGMASTPSAADPRVNHSAATMILVARNP